MIIDKEKLIFIHIPKNAGTSIKSFFKSKEIHHKHKNIKQIKKENIEAYNSYKKFTIVRNPYDRMVSWYFYLKRAMSIEYTRGDYRWKPGEHFPDSFLEWVKNPLGNYYSIWKLSDTHNSLHTDIEINRGGGRIGLPLLSPQYRWIDNTVEVLKYENLNKDLNNFFKKKIDIPSINTTQHKEYINYYNKESLNIVYARYKEDFEKFNYKKI